MSKARIGSSVKTGLSRVKPSSNLSVGLLYGFMAVFLLVSMIDYDPRNYHFFPATGEDPQLGRVGVYTGRWLFALLGISAWLVSLIFAIASWLCFKPTSMQQKIQRILPLALLAVCLSLVADLVEFGSTNNQKDHFSENTIFDYGTGGILGKFMFSGFTSISDHDNRVHGYLRIWLGEAGAWILAIVVLVFSIWILISIRLEKWKKFISDIKGISAFWNNDDVQTANQTRPSKQNSIGEEFHGQHAAKSTWAGRIGSFLSPKQVEDPLFGDVSKQGNSNEQNATSSKLSPTREISLTEEPKEKIEENNKSENLSENEITDDQASFTKTEKGEVNKSSSDSLDGFKVVRAEKTEKATDLFPERKGDYHFPVLDLLMEPPEEASNGDEDHMVKARRLKDTLAEFKIEVDLGEVHTGPVITRYDIHPAAGVRVEKIANLDKNLAMALRSESVRILAPVPGKGCVGVEVPNAQAAPVCLKEILQSKAWAEANAEIPIVLGKEASGRPLVADLTKMPHLLVAGSTGSGKTVCINAIIASLCYHSSPEDVRFIMVDPKIVEMKVYNDLPHMLIPVVTEPKKVPGALKWLLAEMERRYQIFSKIGVRNIAGFNAKILKDKQEKEKAQLLDAEMTAEERAALSSIQVPRDDDALEVPENKLPYIVCIIDELADLMMVAQADVETGIARLAQLARAAGIHLIIATQRPSVNVITGVIKANLPSRISFRVASYRDSQTILDGKGAESLIGKGDMLFIPPGSAAFMRAQGAFVSDDEINGIVDYLKVNGPPQIIEEVRQQIESAGEDEVLGLGDHDSDDDPMLKKAIEIIRTTKRASTSNLQRKLSIGYNRAARIMDELEERGVVGPDIPGQGREILLDM